MAKRACFQFKDIHGFLDALFRDDVHAKRVYSLANATMGVMTSASLAIHAMGQGLAQARGKLTKHAVKQVDRLLSNAGVQVWPLFALWVPYAVGPRKRIAVAMDWTDFDPDGQATIMLSLLTRHGRATPLLWLTVDKGTLKEHRNAYEDRVLMRLAEVLPEGVRVPTVALGIRSSIISWSTSSSLAMSFAFAAISTSPTRKAGCGQRQTGSGKRDVHAPCAGQV